MSLTFEIAIPLEFVLFLPIVIGLGVKPTSETLATLATTLSVPLSFSSIEEYWILMNISTSSASRTATTLLTEFCSFARVGILAIGSCFVKDFGVNRVPIVVIVVIVV